MDEPTMSAIQNSCCDLTSIIVLRSMCLPLKRRRLFVCLQTVVVHYDYHEAGWYNIMKIRIASVDEQTFTECLESNLWGANNVYNSKWEPGDKLVFKVKDHIVASATISGPAYMDDLVVWTNGLYWNRNPLKFDYVLPKDKHISFSEKYTARFVSLWGKKYGWVILNKYPLPDDLGQDILRDIEAQSNAH